MMHLAQVAALEQLHKQIMEAQRHYTPPWHLLERVDEEYRGYVLNSDGWGQYYQWLALLVRRQQPKLVVELGSNLGVSTVMLYSELADDASLISVDLHRNLAFVPDRMYIDERVRFVFGDDLNLAIYGSNLPAGIDLLFIDTVHTREQLNREWAVYQHLCNPGAIVVLDDIRMEDMFGSWESLPYPQLEVTTDCHYTGFGFFVCHPGTVPDPAAAYRAALDVAYERVNIAEWESLDASTMAMDREPQPPLWQRLRMALRAKVRGENR